MRRALRLTAAFLRRDLLVDVSYRGGMVFSTLAGLFSLWSLYFVGRTFGPTARLAVSGGDYFLFALVGVAVAVPLRAGMSGVTGRVRELQVLGGLEPLMAAPVNAFGSALLLALYPMLRALWRGALLLLLGVIFFGARLPQASAGGALAALALGLLAYLGLGILSAAFVLVLKRGDPVAWAVDALTFLVSGIFYPIDVLPAPLRAVSDWIPATHALSALRRSLLQGATVPELGRELTLLAIMAAVLLPASAVLLRAALRRAQREGSLGQA